MTIRAALAAALLVLSLGGAARAADVRPFDASAFAEAQGAGRPILVFVEAPWCPTCAKERPILSELYKLPEFAALQVFTVDFDTSKPLLRQLNVPTQSTLIAFHGAQEKARTTGATDPGAIRALLDAANG